MDIHDHRMPKKIYHLYTPIIGEDQGTRYKMAFIQWQPHTVPAACSKKIIKDENLLFYINNGCDTII